MRTQALFALSSLAPSALAGVIPRESGNATSSSPNSLKADIRADTDRDGFVDIEGSSDVDTKTVWNATHGAIFLPNIGDTDKRCSNALLKGPAVSNEKLDACNDASDDILRNEEFLAPLLTVPMTGLPNDATGRVYLKDPVQRSKVRIFYQANENSIWTYVDGNYTFSAAALREGLALGVDGRDVRRPNGWDGRALVTFDVKSSSGSSSDSVMLRVAPVLTHSHLDPVQQVLSVKANQTDSPLFVRFNDQLQKAVNESGLEEDVYLFSGSDDIWAQDFMEPDFASMPGPCGPVSVRIMIRSPQDDRVAGRQLFEYYRDTGIGAVQQLGGARDKINSGGNIETIPPYEFNGTSWPAGRVIIGNQGQQRNFLVPFFQAQETQDPLLIDTDWLVAGHVDEVLQFIPADSERGWVIVVNDPTAGVKMLQDIKASGQGSQPVFSRKNDTSAFCNDSGCDTSPVESTTINEILANADLMSTQKLCAERVEKNLRILKDATGVTDEEIIRMPAMFRRLDLSSFPGNSSDNSTNFSLANVPDNAPGNSSDVLKVRSMWPNIVNGLVMSGFDTYIMPNPWGPLVNGTDVLLAKAKQEYGRLGMEVIVIDDWNTHYNSNGDIHCGTNSVRDMDVEWYGTDLDGDDEDDGDDSCVAYGDDGDDGADGTDGAEGVDGADRDDGDDGDDGPDGSDGTDDSDDPAGDRGNATNVPQ